MLKYNQVDSAFHYLYIFARWQKPININIEIMKYLCIAFILLHFIIPLSAQSDELNDNVTISSSTVEYKFVKGNKENPVIIECSDKKSYKCQNFRTTIGVSEFYNDKIKLSPPTVVIDGSRTNINPKYAPYNEQGIFHSDQKVCYFELALPKKGSIGNVNFEKKILEPYYFTSVYFTENYRIDNQNIVISVPEWMEVEIREYNFGNLQISKNIVKEGKNTIYTYNAKNLPANTSEKSTPGPTHIYPHLMVMCKSANINNKTITYFKTLDDQYAWYRNLVTGINKDSVSIAEQTGSIVKGISDDKDKVKSIFQWVQDNIRYIAFEDGMAGFVPDHAHEVLRKKYGDCKGMANLMVEMLKSQGLDARKCWIGTKHIAHDYSTPSLSVDNHMICAWFYNGKTYFLDATEKFIGFDEVAERIQGRPVLVENGAKYILDTVPHTVFEQNTSIERRTLKITGNDLVGHVDQVYKGENKEWLLNNFHYTSLQKQETALKDFLAGNKKNMEISNLKISNLTDYNKDIALDFDIVWKNALTTFGEQTYMDVDDRKFMSNMKFDLEKRKYPYSFTFKDHVIFETTIILPDHLMVNSLPEMLEINQPKYTFKATYGHKENKVTYRNEIIIKNADLSIDDMKIWNKDIEKLSAFYNEQIELNNKK